MVEYRWLRVRQGDGQGQSQLQEEVMVLGSGRKAYDHTTVGLLIASGGYFTKDGYFTKLHTNSADTLL